MIDLDKKQPKYYAMIDGERKGPFPLEELPAAGVRPSTYVWTAGMEDWEKAEEVADICRLFRVRIHDLMHPSSVGHEPLQTSEPTEPSAPTPGLRMNQVELPSIDEIESRKNYEVPPANMIPLAILVSLLFCPPLGLAGLYFAIQCKKKWKEGEKQAAHENCRSAKMWTGIGLFIGIMAYAFVMRFHS